MAASSRADIYRWEDDRGTVHFTDDLTTIPPRYRKDSTLMIREAPASLSSPEAASPPGGPQAPYSGSVEGNGNKVPEEAKTAEQEKEELAAQVEQLEAKIAAKEEHIRAVDAKRSLALNPLRNRYVDAEDMELYEKYRKELPADREHLKELESLLESVK